jgi:RNA polymerase-interacting CarD/CdnL/TRCF family regulator
MFKEGDAVVHPIRGAGVIRCVEERRWRGAEALYYRIGLLSQPTSSLMIPVGSAKELGLRRAVSRSRLSQVWKVLDTDPEKLPTEHKERYQLLEDKLHAGDVLQVAEAVRDMAWRRHREGRLTTRGKRMYEEGMTLLAGEIAAAKGIGIEDAEVQVRDRLLESFQVEVSA